MKPNARPKLPADFTAKFAEVANIVEAKLEPMTEEITNCKSTVASLAAQLGKLRTESADDGTEPGPRTPVVFIAADSPLVNTSDCEGPCVAAVVCGQAA